MRFLLLSLLSALPLQAADNPMVNHLLDHWAKSKTYMIALANQMPADQYTSRPNAEEMTFGEQMVHIANAIVTLTKGYAPAKLYPAKNTTTFFFKTADRATAIIDLGKAFDAGAAAIGSLSDADLATKVVETPEGKMTALEAVLLVFDHTEHHRGQAIVDLRYKGIKPVDYEF
jgi:uncharacterized damage-inducible protein DinB